MARFSKRATLYPRSNAAFMKENWEQWPKYPIKPSVRRGQPDFWRVYRRRVKRVGVKS